MTNICYLCGSKELTLIEKISKKPDVEVNYNIPKNLYYREIYNCNICGVYNNFHDLINEDFYKGFYNNSITSKSFEERFQRIINLPESNSDNKNRVKRVVSFLKNEFGKLNHKKALDIGSGTGVFLYELKKENLFTTCIDPDLQSINHALNVIKVDKAHCGSLTDFKSTLKYDLITFNKVLEHLKDPIANIKKALKHLSKNGILYIEMPEGDRIVNEKLVSKRAEFAVEHYTIYNEKSIKGIAELCSLKIIELNVINDPSGKKTIYAFYKEK